MINLSLVNQRKCKEGEIKMMELRKITGKNIEEVIALEVGENQKTFLETTNLKSFADAHMLNTDGIPATPGCHLCR